MRLNARGDYAGGASGGGSELISINGAALTSAPMIGMPERGHLGGWFDNNRLCYQHEGIDGVYLAFYDLRTGEISQADSRGANTLRAGGGVWAAWQDGIGLFSSSGQNSATADLYDVGPDGSILYKPIRQSGGGLALNGVEIPGAVVSIDDAQSVGGGRVIWRDGERLMSNFAGVLPTLAGQFWRPKARDVNGVVWLLYFHVSGLVLHPANSFLGYRLAPSAFSPDFIAIGDIIRVVWSTTEGEAPSTIAVKDIALSEPRIDLRGQVVVTPPVDPIDPPKEPIPVSVPDFSQLAADVFNSDPALIAALRQGSDETDELRRRLGNDHPDVLAGERRVNAMKATFTRRIAWSCYQRDQRFGLRLKTGGTNAERPADGKLLATDVLMMRDTGQIIDVMSDRNVSWGVTPGDTQPLEQWVQPLEEGASEPHEPPTDPIDPPPTGIDLKPRVVKLEMDVASLTSLVGGLETNWQHALELLASRVRELENRPAPGGDFVKHGDPVEVTGVVSIKVPLWGEVKKTVVSTGTL